MENNVKAKLIVDIIRRFAVSATTEYINAKAEMARTQMGHDLWEKEPRNELGWSPYKVEIAEKMVELKLKEKIAREKVLAYAIDVFLEKIPK